MDANNTELWGMDNTSDSYGNSTMIPPQPSLSVGILSPIMLTITGVAGNTVALVILYTSKAEVKKTAYFILLIGQAWSDLLSYLITAPMPIIVYANNFKWVGGMPVCVITGFVLIAFGMLLPLFVSCLSIERLMALRFPYFYSSNVTLNKARLAFLMCWVFVFAFCSMPFLGLGSYTYQFPGTWCFINFHNESNTDTIFAYMYAIFNICVIGFIVCCNIAVVTTLIKMKRAKRVAVSPVRHGGAPKDKKSRFQMEMETQMVWFLCCVTVVFVTCWLPLNIQILINLSTGEFNLLADVLVIRLASVNQVLDPWFYILLRKSVINKITKPFKRLLGIKIETVHEARTTITNVDGPSNTTTVH